MTMKTPKSKKKKNKKGKETFKDVDTIDLTSSPAPSSGPASSPSTRPDAHSVPNSPAKSAADNAAMPPPTSRPGEKSVSRLLISLELNHQTESPVWTTDNS
ncbi:hypothetical protein FALCPG4_007233 [Fusarium falciforme]